MDFTRITEAIPEYERFYTVDEHNKRTLDLAERFPEFVSVYKGGTSRSGEPVYILKIGSGSKNALLFGCPHPNEPIGAMMIDFFSEALATNEQLRNHFDYTWYLIKVIDVDGTKLNEGWFKASKKIENYAQDFYRPPQNEQVEWTFPIDYKTLQFDSPLPETKILMQLIEEKKPAFMYSLHNCGFGGAYYYISKASNALYSALQKIPQTVDIPLALGEPEIPGMEKWTEAVYNFITTKDLYEFIKKHHKKDPALVIHSGASSDEYAQKHGQTFSLVCEVPYYFEPSVQNTAPGTQLRKKAKHDSLNFQKEVLQFLEKIMNTITPRMGNMNSPFYRSIMEFISSNKEMIEVEKQYVDSNPDFERMATVAEEFDSLYLPKFYCLLHLGMLKRLINEIIQTKGEATVLSESMQVVDEKFTTLAATLNNELDYKAIPIKKLVSVQLLAGLYSAEYVQGENV